MTQAGVLPHHPTCQTADRAHDMPHPVLGLSASQHAILSGGAQAVMVNERIASMPASNGVMPITRAYAQVFYGQDAIIRARIVSPFGTGQDVGNGLKAIKPSETIGSRLTTYLAAKPSVILTDDSPIFDDGTHCLFNTLQPWPLDSIGYNCQVKYNIYFSPALNGHINANLPRIALEFSWTTYADHIVFACFIDVIRRQYI